MMNLHEEASRCLLCEQAPCTKACQTGDPARAIRAIRFDNEKNAWQWVKDCEEAVCTAVMQYGYRIIDDMIEGMQTYMVERGIDRLEDLVGEQLPNFVLPSDLDRDTMVYPKIDREKCIGCGRCYVSCLDGGHQAITFDGDTRQPHIVGTKCVGCHLCRLVCPVGAIGLAKRINKPIK